MKFPYGADEGPLRVSQRGGIAGFVVRRLRCAASRTLCTGLTLGALVLAAGCPNGTPDDAGMPGMEAGVDSGFAGDVGPRPDGAGPDPAPSPDGDPPPDERDAGEPPPPMAEAGPNATKVVIEFAARTDTLEGELTSGMIGVANVVARNDRASLEPERQDVGVLNLMSEPRITLAGAVPATYGRVSLELGQGPWGSALELRFLEPGRGAGPGTMAPRVSLIELRDSDVSIDVRCDPEPAELAPGAQVRMTLTLDAGRIQNTLGELELPAEAGNMVRVNEQQTPEAARAVKQTLEDAWTLRCTR